MEISYKVEGLRSLNSMPFIDLRPVTILVGLNNSGKSTFLRSLQLIKLTAELDSETPIYWQAGFCDFGSFETSLNQERTKKQEEISFSFKVSNVTLQNNTAIYETPTLFELLLGLHPELRPNLELGELIFTFLIGKSKNNIDTIKSIKINLSIGNKNIEYFIGFSDDGSNIDKITVDGNNIIKILNYKIIHFTSKSIFLKNLFFEFDKIENQVFRKLNNILPFSQIFQIFDGFIFGNITFDIGDIFHNHENIIGHIKNSILKHFNRIERKEELENIIDDIHNSLSEKHKNFINDVLNIFLLWVIIEQFYFVINNFFSNLKYSAPIRSKHERVIISDALVVSDIDAEGKNLPNFLSSIGVENREKFGNWVKRNFGYDVCVRDHEEYISTLIKFGQRGFNIVDTGFGITQLLPVLAKFWWAKYRPLKSKFNEIQGRTLAIEQPELHLHPRQQADLANAVTSILTEDTELPNPRFIIETHSEKLVSRFGRLIEENRIAHTDIQVVRFEVDPLDPVDSKIHVSEFTEDGSLTNWKYGFFNSGPPRG